ncbi:MAG: serine hydrolase domain-containing protein [Dehalococcoidia bacterium]
MRARTRRDLLRWSASAGGSALLLATAARLPTEAAPAEPSTQVQASASGQSEQAAQIIALVQEAMEKYYLNAAIVRVTVDGQEVVTAAFGESMTGVPATTEMHFRNGAVAISYVAMLVLTLVDDGVLRLDDPLSIWMPELPDSDKVTVRMLLNMTAGYPDFVSDQGFQRDFYANPFKQWTPQELVAISLSQPRLFAPGTNWDYAHANYVILGLALERATGRSVADLLQERVLDPLGLWNTVGSVTAAIPKPALHSFSSERRDFLGIPAGTPFLEETSFWSPSWTITHGAIETTNIYDMAASAVAIGEGTLLSPASHQAMVAPTLLGFGSPLEGCFACRTLDNYYNYGLGVVRSGNWLLQNLLLNGYGGTMAYLPGKKIAIAFEMTDTERSFEPDTRMAARVALFTSIGGYLAPDDAPPTGP